MKLFYLVILTASKWSRAYVNQFSAESDDRVRSYAIFFSPYLPLPRFTDFTAEAQDR